MSKENLQLVSPTLELSDGFHSFCRNLRTKDLSKIHGIGSMMCGNDFSDGVIYCNEHVKGLNLPEGWVPASTWWLVRNNQVVIGTISLRHKLTPFLEAEGGHIVYKVHANERGRGYATYMLACIVDKAKEMELNRLLVICEKDKKASIKVAQKNGGIKGSEIISSIINKPIVHYWIEII
jgi:predicted acetyltransferase